MEIKDLRIGDIVICRDEKMIIVAVSEALAIAEDKNGSRWSFNEDTNWKPYSVTAGRFEGTINFLKILNTFKVGDTFNYKGREFRIDVIDIDDVKRPILLNNVSWSDTPWFASLAIFKEYLKHHEVQFAPVQKCKHHETGFCKRYQSRVGCNIELPPCEHFEEVQ